MSIHTFDTEVACELGLNAAVIYQSFTFWVEKNAANDKHLHDGFYWSYNSVKALQALFPYMSGEQIRRAIEKLEEAGYLKAGNYNETAYDRTKWFCCPRLIHLARMPNGIGENAEPIPDSKPDTVPDSDPMTRERDLFGSQKTDEEVKERSAEIRDAFEGFWKIYPKSKRKTDRPKAFEIYRRIVRGQHRTIPKTDPWVIHAGLARFAASGPDPDYVPLPTTWLNGARWEADYGSAPAEARRRPFAAPDWERVER